MKTRLLLFLFLVPCVSAQLYSTDHIFKTLDVNDDRGFSEFTIYAPTDIKLDDISFTFVMRYGSVSNVNAYVGDTCYDITPQYEKKEVCNISGCGYENIVSGYEYDPYFCWNKTRDIPAGEHKIRLEADISIEEIDENTYGYLIDWIPKIKIDQEYKQEAWAWWNASYSYRYNISNITVNKLLPINATHSSGGYGESDIDSNNKTEIIYCEYGGADTYLYFNTDTSLECAAASNKYTAEINRSGGLYQKGGLVSGETQFYLPLQYLSGGECWDISGNKKNASYHGDPVLNASEVVGNMLMLDPNDYLITDYSYATLMNGNPFVYSMWMKATTPTDNFTALYWGGDVGGVEWVRVSLNRDHNNNAAPNKVQINIRDNAVKCVWATKDNTTLLDENWHHLLVYADAYCTTREIYIDGVKQNISNSTDLDDCTNPGSDCDMHINSDYLAGDYGMRMEVDEIFLEQPAEYETVTAQQIYTSTRGSYLSTYETSTTTTTTEPGGCDLTYWGYKELCVVDEWHNQTCLYYSNTTGYNCSKDYLLKLNEKSDIRKKPSSFIDFLSNSNFWLRLAFALAMLSIIYFLLWRVVK